MNNQQLIPETDPLPDEIEAIERLDLEIASGEYLIEQDIKWK